MRESYRKGIIASAMVAILLIVTVLPSVSTGAVDQSGSEDYAHVLVYHPGAPSVDSGYNAVSSYGEVEVIVNGVVTTGYNPQVEPLGDSTWYGVTKYSVGRTTVFTGWEYATSFDTDGNPTSWTGPFAPGEVLSNGQVEDATQDGRIHIRATWGTLSSLGQYSYGGYNRGYTWSGTQGDVYTNVLLLGNSTTLDSLRVDRDCTIRGTDQSRTLDISGKDTVLRYDLILDGLTLKGNHGVNHGDGSYGLFANGHLLVIGKYVSTGTSSDVTGYPQVFGGSNGGSVSGSVTVTLPVEGSTDVQADVSTSLIIHDGVFGNVVAGSRNGTVDGSTYLVVKDAVILDTLIGACSGSGKVNGSTFVYLSGVRMSGDYYEEHSIDTGYVGESGGVLRLSESTIITGGSNNGSVHGDTHVMLSGDSRVWDVQAGGRRGASSVDGTAHLEVSGNATVVHVACGSITDGISSEVGHPSVTSTDITVRDGATVASVFGAGYDTFYSASYPSMYGPGSSIEVSILGGVVGYVYGAGYRGDVGTEDEPIGSVTVSILGGTVLQDVFGGGRGGLDKICHDIHGSDSWGTSDTDPTGRSLVYAERVTVVVGEDATVNGDVYGGGESTPVILEYDGVSRVYGGVLASNGLDSVASMTCDVLEITVQGTVHGNVYGTGKGVDTSDLDRDGRHVSAYIIAIGDGEVVRIPWIGDGETVGTVLADIDYTGFANVDVNGENRVSASVGGSVRMTIEYSYGTLRYGPDVVSSGAPITVPYGKMVTLTSDTDVFRWYVNGTDSGQDRTMTIGAATTDLIIRVVSALDGTGTQGSGELDIAMVQDVSGTYILDLTGVEWTSIHVSRGYTDVTLDVEDTVTLHANGTGTISLQMTVADGTIGLRIHIVPALESTEIQ